ncbi:MAG: hydroxymethylbilane synthase [Bacteroidota bacterium]
MEALRLGTRKSELALWQAQQVASSLQEYCLAVEIVAMSSQGDQNLKDPLHRMGITGIFTKVLDDALLADEIDLAVHSLKDVPTQLPAGIELGGVLERGPVHDVLVHQGNTDFLASTQVKAIIATGSLRRRAQWKRRFPHHELVGLRGNVNTRLQKLADNGWHGAIFAEAGLARIHRLPASHLRLDWMIPAPAQGIIGMACREGDQRVLAALSALNHASTWVEAEVERQFMRKLEGGCTAPIGAKAVVVGDQVSFEGVLLTPDGKEEVRLKKRGDLRQASAKTWGESWAQEALATGGAEIMHQIKRELST